MSNKVTVENNLNDLRKQIREAFKASVQCVQEIRSRNDFSVNAQSLALHVDQSLKARINILDREGKIKEEIVEQYLHQILDIPNIALWLELINEGDDDKVIANDLFQKIFQQSSFLSEAIKILKGDKDIIDKILSEISKDQLPPEIKDNLDSGTIRMSSVVKVLSHLPN